MKFFAFLFLFFLWGGEVAHAHGFSRSVSSWRISDKGAVAVRFSAPLLVASSVSFGDATQSPAERFRLYLNRSVALAPCRRTGNKATLQGSRVSARLKFQCPPIKKGEGKLKIIIHSFFDADPSHVHFARFYFGGKAQEIIFSSQTQEFEINLASLASANVGAAQGQTLTSYTALGVKHILAGVDHLAFVLALLLVCGFGRGLMWAITGFTLGHSLTLALASTSWLVASIPAVEALIGWTILLMALEYSGLRNHNFFATMVASAIFLGVCLVASFFFPARLTAVAFLGLMIFSLCWGAAIKDETHAKKLVPILSVVFGLIHGLGFATVLNEIGLPPENFFTALFGFNLGVEVGQLSFIAALFLIAWLLQRAGKGELLTKAQPFIASLLVGLGVYWFVGRTFF